MATPERVTLSVEDFGPIAHATIDLRPLTVFVGPSNTGKSYLAILLYALHQFFGGTSRGVIFPLHHAGARSEVAAEQIEAARSPLQQMLDHIPDRGRFDVVLPDEIASLVRPVLQTAGEMAPFLDAQVKRCFGVSESGELVRQPGGKGARVALRRVVDDCSAGLVGYDFAITRKNARLAAWIPADMPLRIHGSAPSQWLLRHLATAQQSASLANKLADLVVPSIVGAVGRPIHYLPADRAGIMHAHRVVVSSLIGRASRAGIDAESPLPVLSGVLADFLERLVELGDERKPTASQQLAERLETDILGGSVVTSRSNVGYPSFHYRPANWQHDLPLMNTSSMVSELAPVALYLRHVVQPDDVLIIEEPESHLHPAMQVSFTHYLAAVVKAGIRVIVTTHSEWVLEALANLVRLSEVPEARRSKISGGPALKPEEVGAWLFERKKRPQGSVVKEIPLDTVRGTFPAGFGDITEQLYNDWASITNLARRADAEKT